jgi:hypothetical protein
VPTRKKILEDWKLLVTELSAMGEKPNMCKPESQISYAGVGMGRSATPEARFLLLMFSLP